MGRQQMAAYDIITTIGLPPPPDPTSGSPIAHWAVASGATKRPQPASRRGTLRRPASDSVYRSFRNPLKLRRRSAADAKFEGGRIPLLAVRATILNRIVQHNEYF